jgi:hypothetical protein
VRGRLCAPAGNVEAREQGGHEEEEAGHAVPLHGALGIASAEGGPHHAHCPGGEAISGAGVAGVVRKLGLRGSLDGATMVAVVASGARVAPPPRRERRWRARGRGPPSPLRASLLSLSLSLSPRSVAPGPTDPHGPNAGSDLAGSNGVAVPHHVLVRVPTRASIEAGISFLDPC